MKHFSYLLAAVVGIGLAPYGPTWAADPRYPDWPCAQAKVPEVSVAAVWAGPPLDPSAEPWESDERVKDLVSRLAPRRTPIEEAQKGIADFVTGSADERIEKAKLLFAGLFDRLNRERTEVLNGIDRLGRHQKELAAKIRSDISDLHQLQAAANPDEAKLQEIGTQVEWSTRIFEDRRKTVRYVCEVPVQIERRLFALSRAVQQALQ